MEDEERTEQPSMAATRGQNQLHLLPEEWRAAESVIAPLVARLSGEADAGVELLIVTSDSEAAAGIAARLAASDDASSLRILAATEPRRAARAMKQQLPQVLLASAEVLGVLLRGAVVKLETVKTAVLAWVNPSDSALEAVMTEVPRDAARVVLAHSATPEVEALVERYARRPRRPTPDADPAPPVSLSYVVGGEATRATTVRRLLDALDPESAVIVVHEASERRHVEGVLRALGYGNLGSTVKVAATAEDARLVVLYDLPANADELRRMVRGNEGARFIALISPRQIDALRQLAGGDVSPMMLPEAAARARSSEDRVRDELRAVLRSGQFSRELMAIEPLLEEFDGAEIAAATLRLLESERTRAQSVGTIAGPPQMTRLYLNIGEMDGARPADIVGAIVNEASVARSEVGRVEIRERHATVEVATPIADTVVSKMTGVTLKGRRILAKVDSDAGRKPRGDRPVRGDFPMRGDRPQRGGPRGARGPRDGDRGPRGPRGEGGPRSRPPRER